MNSEESGCAPLRFFERSCLLTEGLLLTDFGMAVDAINRATGTEHFFAHGHQPDGLTLQVARQLSGNELVGWEEAHVVVFQHWFSPFELDGPSDEPYCWSTYSERSTSPTGEPSLRSTPYPATIIRHKSWHEFMGDGNLHPQQAAYHCRTIRDWYAGASTQFGGHAPSPHDLGISHSDDLLGFAYMAYQLALRKKCSWNGQPRILIRY